jgi:hypothetical protein
MDHVVPRCLFATPLPPDLVTVEVCEECNNKKSLNDSYLRDLLVMDDQCSAHPVARELMGGKVIRSAKSNRSEIARLAINNASLKPRFTSGGLYVGHYLSFPINGERLNQTFQTMVRGLYYRLRKIPLPDDYTFQIRRVDPLHVQEAFNEMKKLGANGPYVLGDVFGCMFIYTAEDENMTHWLLWFYGGFVLTVLTHRTGETL